MLASILIVSKNRKEELDKTLNILKGFIDKEVHELKVFLDGCTDNSIDLKNKYPWISWQESEICLGASQARSILYATARGNLLFGFDDDAHPLQPNFIQLTEQLFYNNPKVGIIAFKEVKGIEIDTMSSEFKNVNNDILVNDFLGCGFCVKRDVYNASRGFPIWIDIYGEEVCVALETLENGYDILYTNKIVVNHRVDSEFRKSQGANYFRFGKQLKNTSFFYLVYYPVPLMIFKIARLYFLNMKKYALQDKYYWKEYWTAARTTLLESSKILKFRKRVSKHTLKLFNSLSTPNY